MREISCNTGGVDNIVEGELVNEGAELEEKGQWLSLIVGVSFLNYPSLGV